MGKYKHKKQNNLPLTCCVGYVRLITAVEKSLGDQLKRFDRWFRLELFDVDVVLNMQLQNRITGTFGLYFNRTPGIWNLNNTGTTNY